jgi:hypothetical protein
MEEAIMASRQTAAVNPFAAAKRSAPQGSSKPKTGVYVAADLPDPKDPKNILLKQAQIVEAIENYCQGNRMVNEGEAMKETNRPSVLLFARHHFALDWLMNGKFPNNPKVAVDQSGAGTVASVIFQDREIKLTNDEYADYSNLVGAKNAEATTISRDEFWLNPELLEQEIEAPDEKGKPVKKRIMEHIADALGTKFAKRADILSNLFHVKPKFCVAKGTIHKGVELVCPNGPKDPATSTRLVDFLIKGKFVTQIKPGANA